MKTIFKCLISISLVCFSITSVWSQRDSIRKYTTLGKQHFREQNFYDATVAFRLAKSFDGLPADHDLDKWIEASFDGYVVLLKQAEEKSSKLARASELAGQAYKLAKTNPTHALRLAEYAVNADPQSRSAVQQLHDIASSYPAPFYSLDLQTTNDSSYIVASCISPDEQYFLIGDSDHAIRLWKMDGQLVHDYFGHKGHVTDLDFFPNGNAFVSASMDNTLKIWSLDGALLHTLSGHWADVVAVKVSSDGNVIASASWDKSFRLWTHEGKLLLTVENAHDDFLTDIDLSADGKLILTSSWDKTAKIWSYTGELLQTLKGHNAIVSSACFSPDAQSVLTGSWDKTARLWNKNGVELAVFSGLSGHQTPVNKVIFHRDNKSVFTGGDDNQIKRWDKNGSLLQTYKGHSSPVRTLYCSEQSNYLLSSSGFMTFIWPLKGELLQRTVIDSAAVRAIGVAPDGKTLVSGLTTGEIAVLDSDGGILKRFTAHRQGTTSIVFSPDGERFISGSEEDIAKIWDLNGNVLYELAYPQGNINAVAWSAQNTCVAAAGWGDILIWDLQGLLIKTIKVPKSPKGDNRIYGLVFSPDGKSILASSRFGEVYMWNIDTEEKTIFKGEAESIVYSVVFSPDGKLILSGGVDKILRLWDTTGKELRRMEGHTQGILSVAFSPDGKWFLSGSLDNTVKLWRFEGMEAFSLYGHEGSVNTVVFSSDSKVIYSGSDDQTCNKWVTLDTYLKSDRIKRLSNMDRKKYGLESGQTPETTSSPTATKNPDNDFYIIYNEKKIAASREMRDYYNVSMRYSRKAWEASDALERLQYQQISILRCKKALELLGGKKPNPITAGFLSHYYVNQALWYLMNRQSDQALESMNEALKFEIEDFLRSLFRAKLSLVYIFNNRFEEAKQILEEVKNRSLTEKDNYSAYTIGIMGFYEKKDISIREIILKDIEMLENAGVTHPDLPEFRKILEIRS